MLTQYRLGSLYTPIVGTTTYNNVRVKSIHSDPYLQRLSACFTLNVNIAQTITYQNKQSLELSSELQKERKVDYLYFLGLM